MEHFVPLIGFSFSNAVGKSLQVPVVMPVKSLNFR